jgi:hypothetical protein
VRLEDFGDPPARAGRANGAAATGLTRRLRFLAPVTVTTLSHHRMHPALRRRWRRAGKAWAQLGRMPDGTRVDLAGNDEIDLPAGASSGWKRPAAAAGVAAGFARQPQQCPKIARDQKRKEAQIRRQQQAGRDVRGRGPARGVPGQQATRRQPGQRQQRPEQKACGHETLQAPRRPAFDAHGCRSRAQCQGGQGQRHERRQGGQRHGQSRDQHQPVQRKAPGSHQAEQPQRHPQDHADTVACIPDAAPEGRQRAQKQPGRQTGRQRITPTPWRSCPPR